MYLLFQMSMLQFSMRAHNREHSLRRLISLSTHPAQLAQCSIHHVMHTRQNNRRSDACRSWRYLCPCICRLALSFARLPARQTLWRASTSLTPRAAPIIENRCFNHSSAAHSVNHGERAQQNRQHENARKQFFDKCGHFLAVIRLFKNLRM